MQLNRFNYSFVGLLLFHTIILLLIANDFSLSYKEENFFLFKLGLMCQPKNIHKDNPIKSKVYSS